MKRVMIVEDEEFILQGILCIIDWKDINMEVAYIAHNGKEALEKFRKDPVDIIITDVEMPLMDGLELIREIRKEDTGTRCLILSGYDEFEYARTALSLDVEEYILKPVNEEMLRKALVSAARKLDEIERKNAANMEEKIGWAQFLKGKGTIRAEEQENFAKILPSIKESEKIFPALMKIDLESLDESDGITPILIEFQNMEEKIRPVYLKTDLLLLLFYCGEEREIQEAERIFGEIQNRIESGCGIMTFVAAGTEIRSYGELPECYQRMNYLLRYRIMTGWGRCVSEQSIFRKKKPGGIDIDLALLRKKILKKDQDGAMQYLEELFIRMVESGSDIDAVYQNALKAVLLLQDIKNEYKINDSKTVKSLSEIFDHIYQAEDIAGMRTVLVLEISAVVMALHTEDSHYTPVIREILSYIHDNYKEDLSLKILSYKYHMNASYLGQIFQKEVGCSFNQYLSNIKNEKAKDMILNTNMKINDIAKEVGYLDTSYFYRKFKQCYGVSPASLRGMKKY